MNRKTERTELVGAHTIHWDADIETVLYEIAEIINDALVGTSYSADRNTTIGEKCVDIFWGTERKANPRVAHVWPKRRTENMDFCVRTELVSLMKGKIDLPADSDIKEGRYSNWRSYRKISISRVLEMISALTGKT